eukprot:2239540-Rhodomonas_salina.2
MTLQSTALRKLCLSSGGTSASTGHVIVPEYAGTGRRTHAVPLSSEEANACTVHCVCPSSGTA